MSEQNLYAERDTESLGYFYVDHVMAMTREKLHAKSAIAAELAHRDKMIKTLENALDDSGKTVADLSSTLVQIAGAVGCSGLDSKLPELVAKLAAREKLYTETVNAMAAYYVNENVPDPESQTAMDLVARLLSLAREANREASEKGTE